VAVLITRGTGNVGAELAQSLVDKGEDVVFFDLAPKYARISHISEKVKVIQGNLANWPEVLNVVKDHNIKGIYHIGSMLLEPSEANPWASFQINVVGTVNILEAARLLGVGRVVSMTSWSTYGLACPATVTDETIQRPTTIHGCCKLYCELLGRFYHNKFGLDFRAVRYCAVVAPGVSGITPGLAHWNAWMIEHAAMGKPFECYVTEDTKIPVLHFKDAAKSLEMLYEAPKKQVKTMVYNIAGVTPSRTAKELEQTVKKYIPEAQVSYKPDPKVMNFYRSRRIDVFDDSRAREEWGWQPTYSDLDKVVVDIIDEIKMHGARYGIA